MGMYQHVQSGGGQPFPYSPRGTRAAKLLISLRASVHKKGCKDCNHTALHLFTNFYSFTSSDFALGFHTLTPINPPTPDTAMITAKTKRYDNTILKNSIKFDITLPHIPLSDLETCPKPCQHILYFLIIYTIIIPLFLVCRQADNRIIHFFIAVIVFGCI